MTGGPQQIDPPADALALTTLPRVDYADAFLVDPPPSGTPEAWGRATLEAAPAAQRAALLSGWTGLGLRLGQPGAAETVLGWPVVRSDADVLLVAADGRLGLSGNLLWMRHDDALLFCTLIAFANPAVRAVWAGIEAGHVHVVRGLLQRLSRG